MNLKKMATCAAVLASFALFTQSEKVMAATIMLLKQEYLQLNIMA